MNNKLKITKTREGTHVRGEGLGLAAPGFTGAPALLITGISQEMYDLIGTEVLARGRWVTVVGPSLIKDGWVLCKYRSGGYLMIEIEDLTPTPKTKTVGLEVEIHADQDPDKLEVRYAPANSSPLPRFITHINTKETHNE